MLELQELWPTPLASSVRYASHVEQAVKLADTLSGATLSLHPELLWMQPVTCHFPPTDDAEDNLETIKEPEFISEDPGPDEVLLGDVLDGGDNDSDEEDDHPDTPVTQLVWQVPEVRAFLTMNL